MPVHPSITPYAQSARLRKVEGLSRDGAVETAHKLDARDATPFGRSLLKMEDAEALLAGVGAAPVAHGHSISDVAGLQEALDELAAAIEALAP